MNSEQYKQVDKFIVTSQVLGKGSFGVVYRGFFKDDHSKIVAVKVTPLEKISSDPKFLELLKREIDIMQTIEHPNIVRMYAATRTARNLYMFLEYCRDGDMKELLKKSGGHLSESEALVYFRQIVEGFKSLYSKNIIHRDIKPANILLHEGTAKITDFGFARVIDGDMEKSNNFSKVGTPLYMSPQILDDQKFSAKCDIWSFGMMLYEMLYGKTPWTANSPYQLFQNIKKIPLEFPSKPVRSQAIKDLLKQMLVVEDKDRISWPEIFNHSLIKFDENSIKENIQKIEEEKDMLLKSVAMNKLYVQTNKVMGFKKNNEVVQMFNKDAHLQQGKNVDDSKKVVYEEKDFAKVIDKQDQDQVARKVIIKIDSYFSNERNIAIFVNYTSTLFFNFYNSKKIAITDHLFFRLFFLFQKLQLIIFKSILAVMEGKKELALFNKQEWAVYNKSSEFTLTQQAIKNDTEFMTPYFKEVFKRTKDVIDKALSKEENAVVKNNMKSFYNVLSEKFENDENFQAILVSTVQEFIDMVKEYVLNPKKMIKDKDFLLVIRLTMICLDRNKEFKWDINQVRDFHKFYEDYENIEEGALLDELTKILK